MSILCVPEISEDFLDILIELHKKNPYALDTFIDNYYNLQFSLKKEINLKFYNYLVQVSPNSDYIEKTKFLAFNNPISNFSEFYKLYLPLLELKDPFINNNKKNENSTADIIKNINQHITEMRKVYKLELNHFYCPPTKEYPIYAYNFYLYLIYDILDKFKKKRINELFENNKKIYEEYTNHDEIIKAYIDVGYFLRDTYTLFSKIGNDINKDLKILKIISFYFQILENIRNYSLISAKLEKVISSLNSTP